MISALIAPVRLIAGFAAGGIVSVVVFGLAWSSFWPSGFEGFGRFVILLLVVAMVGASLGAGLFGVRPIDRLCSSPSHTSSEHSSAAGPAAPFSPS
jgi:hypothetical protein